MAKVSPLQWTGIVGATLAIAGITYGVLKPSTNESERSATALQPKIEITTQSVPLTFQLGTATVDICALKRQGNWQEKNLLLEDYFASIKELGFSRALNFSDGSIANYAYANTSTPSTGHGYNAKSTDFANITEFNEWGGGILKFQFPTDFFEKTLEFTNALGWKNDVVLNKKETWLQCKMKIDKSNGEYIKLCSEVITMKYPNAMSWRDYLTWAKKTRDSITKYYGTTKKIIADQPVLYKGNKEALEWRKEINPTSLSGIYGGDVYWQIDDQVSFGRNQDSNLVKVKYFFDSIVPAQITQFQTLFPGWEIFAGECQIDDNREENTVYVRDNMVECVSWARFFRSWIQNQDIQPIAYQMSLKSMDEALAIRHQTMAMLNKLLKHPSTVTVMTLVNMPGVIGISINDSVATTKHTLLLINESTATYTIQKVWVDGKKKTPTYNLQRQYATDWSTTSVVMDSTTSATLTILPVSVNIVSFDINPTVAPSFIKQ